MAMASPPQMYCGLSSVMWMFWMMMFFAPLAMYRPLPRRTPADPAPMIDLLEPTVRPATPALSYVTWMVVEPAPAFPFVHHEAWLMASCPPFPGHVLDAGRQPFSVTVPSVPLKLNSLSRTMQRAVLSESQVLSSAVEEGTAQAAEPPPVTPLAKPRDISFKGIIQGIVAHPQQHP